MPETYTLQDWIISIAMHGQTFREELVLPCIQMRKMRLQLSHLNAYKDST